MRKYIDAEKLKYEIEKRNLSNYHTTTEGYEEELYEIIASLQQEQPEDIVVVARTFLDALSKTPYNNKPITDAQIIIKQLLLFFENPKEYNPDAILEQPEVDLEKEYKTWWNSISGKINVEHIMEWYMHETARHFYELGLNARKEETK